MLVEQEGHPVRVACEVLDLPRSSYYYRPVEQNERALEQAAESRTTRC